MSRAEAGALRGMLRGVVTSGSGAGLADVPGPEVIAKTGTAEFQGEAGIDTHAWMIAAQGDLAVAVFVEVGESGSRTAGPILEQFLRAAG
jgi:cell division protein FtsI/penicillin-binding protein 2